MVEAQSFKRGCDLVADLNKASQFRTFCVACGTSEAQEALNELGWQLDPPVCPDCLQWAAVGVEEGEPNDRFRVQRHGRFWQVLDRETLVCLVVYRKGAMEVIRRLRECAGAIDER